MIHKGLKEKYQSIKFNELENYMADYESRFYSRLMPRSGKPGRLLGYNGVNFLLNSLQRSRNIFIGFVDCVNRTHRELAFLAVRAHFESTGGVAFFLRHLSKYYDHKIEFEEIDDVLFKLSVGCRTFPDRTKDSRFPEAFNALTLIDGADKIFVEMGGGKKTNPFRSSYERLSEFCHPNTLGLTIASDIIKSGGSKTVVYYKVPEFRKEDFGTLINLMLMSCGFFFHVFDKCFSLLKENEEFPELIK